MKEFKILLSSINDVKTFVIAASMQGCEIDVISGRYVIDAKSIMGLFSLDLAKPIGIRVHGTDLEGAAFYEAVKDFVAEE